MKKVVRYCCEVCGQEFHEKNSCLAHEDMHVEPDGLRFPPGTLLISSMWDWPGEVKEPGQWDTRRHDWTYKCDLVGEVDTVHNWIGVDNVIRKGAVSAEKGELLLIPFNMRDGIALCRGKGNPDWNSSAPHGAGRILSRGEAKRKLNVEAFQADMRSAGVYTTSADATTLDEAPAAYKDMQVILDCIKDTVDVVDMIRPVYNFKAGGVRKKTPGRE